MTLGGAERFFDGIGGVRQLGLTRAAKHLRHYRDGSGKPLELSRDDVESTVLLPRAEEANRQSFETRTFRGRTGNKAVADALRDLPDGGTVAFDDAWQRSSKSSDGSIDTYAALGRTGVLSSGAFKAHRRGDRIRVLGDITHELNSGPWRNPQTPPERPEDKFDFHDGQPGSVPARVLETGGKAKPFPMRYTRQQRVNAEVRVGRDGGLTLDRAIWTPIEQ